MKSDKEFWYGIGQQMKATKEKRQANERERQHIDQVKAADTSINPGIAPRLREILEANKNGN